MLTITWIRFLICLFRLVGKHQDSLCANFFALTQFSFLFLYHLKVSFDNSLFCEMFSDVYLEVTKNMYINGKNNQHVWIMEKITHRYLRLFSTWKDQLCHRIDLVTYFWLVPDGLSLFMFKQIWKDHYA